MENSTPQTGSSQLVCGFLLFYPSIAFYLLQYLYDTTK